MLDLFKSTFLIREEFYEKAAQIILPLIPDLCDEIEECDHPHYILTIGFARLGLFTEPGDDGHGITVFDCDPWCFDDDGISLMERVFKAVSRAVEPGGYIEFMDEETLVRYMFLYDTVERWTVPTVLYAKKETI